MKRTVYNTILISDRAQALVKKHGGTRIAARVLKVDPSYVSRLCSGGKSNPNDFILRHLGLVRSVCYIDDGSDERSNARHNRPSDNEVRVDGVVSGLLRKV